MENLKKSFLVRGNNIVGFSDKKNFSTAPLGTVLSFAGQARPNGYLLCDGASYKVTDYPDLYAVIGNTYGGDSTNFNVPNLVDASQSPAPTMIYIIKAFHTNEGVDSGAGSGEENKIDSISVNGSPVSIDENKNVDITVPDAYDDTALVKRVSDIESDYAKTTEIPSKVSQLENDSNYLSSIPEEYVTETELEAKGYLTEHQDLSDYATKDEIPTVPSKVSELTNDSNYQTAEQVNSTVTTEIAKVVANAPEDFDTLKEMSDWIAGHENDVSAMNRAISDNKVNIETLQTDVANINTSLGGKLGRIEKLVSNINSVGTQPIEDGKMIENYRYILVTTETADGTLRGSTLAPKELFKRGKNIMTSDVVLPSDYYCGIRYLNNSTIHVAECKTIDRLFDVYGII